ncbi:MAG: LLM class flavin-dependent oxidoreductase [Pseudomonadota bacterium]
MNRFGVYLSPFHPVREHPGLAIERDLELICLLDRLAYDIVWIGEHHTGGIEIVAAPEILASAVANRTRTIRLGLALSSMAYQSPLLIADRVLLLDHVSRGRAELAFGPLGTGPDMHAFGLARRQVIDRTHDAIKTSYGLIRGDTVDHETNWYRLSDATPQLRPFRNDIPMTLVAQGIPEEPAALADLDVGLMTLSATAPQIRRDLPTLWDVYTRNRSEHDHAEARHCWTLAGPVHIAASRSDALRNIRFGLEPWLQYMERTTGMEVDGKSITDKAESLVDSGFAIIGSPSDAVSQLKRLEADTGGFGTFLQIAHNWANTSATQTSYELFARYVIPELSGTNRVRKSQWRDQPSGSRSEDEKTS